MTTRLARKFLLVGVSIAALAVSAAEAGAKVFGFTGSVQTYRVPETGEYEIILAGAEGGSSSDGNAGGMGAIVGGDIFLRQNELLGIFVGGAGYSLPGYAGGGGGGTFLGNHNRVFFIAGGGGGGYGDRSIADGRPGRSQRSASAGRGGNGGYGGSGGYGGEGGQDPTGFNGGGGSGLNGPGGDGFYGKKGLPGYGGYAYYGGVPGGGFGGGGGGGYAGGGGGGGFSGGGGGTGGDKAGGGGGGGGGSFIIGRATDTFGFTGAHSGDGYASIVLVPEPSTWAMILAGFSAMGVMLARRARAAKAA